MNTEKRQYWNRIGNQLAIPGSRVTLDRLLFADEHKLEEAEPFFIQYSDHFEAWPDPETRGKYPQLDTLFAEVDFYNRLLVNLTYHARPLILLGDSRSVREHWQKETHHHQGLRITVLLGLEGDTVEIAHDHGSDSLPQTHAPFLLVICAPCGPVKPPQARRLRHAEVLLINMPFAPLNLPSLGLGLLKAALTEYRTETVYFSLELNDRIGPAFYHWVAGCAETTALIGEWLFAPYLDPARDNGTNSDSYFHEVLQQADAPAVSPNMIAELKHLRDAMDSFLDACVDRVLEAEPRLVGFTSVFQQNTPTLALASRLKQRRPDLPIIMGGANCQDSMGQAVAEKFSCIDLVVSGEAEHCIGELVNRMLDMDIPEHRFYRAPSPTNMDTLPIPDHTNFFEIWNDHPVRHLYDAFILFETSRGCWWGQKHHCTFCGLNGSSMTFRSKSADRVLHELEYLAEHLPGHDFQSVDNILGMDYFKSLLPLLAARSLPNLFFEVKANLNKNQVHLLAQAGITRIQPGIESLSDHVLQLMEKGVGALQNIQLLKWCAQYGVYPFWNVLWGFPGETAKDYHQMIMMLPLLTHLTPPGVVAQIRLDRFSPNFEASHERGFCQVRPIPAYAHIYPFSLEDCSRLAYHFTYDWRQPPDTGIDIPMLRKQVADWQANHSQSRLLFQTSGENLLVWDFRPIAKKTLTMFNDLSKDLLLFCDRIRSHTQLVSFLNGTGEHTAPDRYLEPLLEAGFLLEYNGKYLSLGIPVQDQVSPRSHSHQPQ